MSVQHRDPRVMPGPVDAASVFAMSSYSASAPRLRAAAGQRDGTSRGRASRGGALLLTLVVLAAAGYALVLFSAQYAV